MMDIRKIPWIWPAFIYAILFLRFGRRVKMDVIMASLLAGIVAILLLYIIHGYIATSHASQKIEFNFYKWPVARRRAFFYQTVVFCCASIILCIAGFFWG